MENQHRFLSDRYYNLTTAEVVNHMTRAWNANFGGFYQDRFNNIETQFRNFNEGISQRCGAFEQSVNAFMKIIQQDINKIKTALHQEVNVSKADGLSSAERTRELQPKTDKYQQALKTNLQQKSTIIEHFWNQTPTSRKPLEDLEFTVTALETSQRQKIEDLNGALRKISEESISRVQTLQASMDSIDNRVKTMMRDGMLALISCTVASSLDRFSWKRSSAD